MLVLALCLVVDGEHGTVFLRERFDICRHIALLRVAYCLHIGRALSPMGRVLQPVTERVALSRFALM